MVSTGCSAHHRRARDWPHRPARKRGQDCWLGKITCWQTLCRREELATHVVYLQDWAIKRTFLWVKAVSIFHSFEAVELLITKSTWLDTVCAYMTGHGTCTLWSADVLKWLLTIQGLLMFFIFYFSYTLFMCISYRNASKIEKLQNKTSKAIYWINRI